METINTFFKGLADKIGGDIGAFFKANTLLFNNLFLAVVAVFSLVMIVILSLIGRKKKDVKYYRAAERI